MSELDEKEKQDFKDAMFKFKWGVDYIVEAINKFPKLISADVCGNKEDTLDSLAELISTSVNLLKAFEENINSKKTKVCDELDAAFTAIDTRYSNLHKRIRAMNDCKLEVNTYQMQSLLDLLEKLERVSPETWQRFETICKKLGKE